MILCLHEEHAVATPTATPRTGSRWPALHSNVGLMHGLMMIFNAWCDWQPMLILGATGLSMQSALAVDRLIHTAQDQGVSVTSSTGRPARLGRGAT
jgi:hypothetical protein